MKYILVLLLLFISQGVQAKEYNVVCPSTEINVIEKETPLKKYSGISFVSKKITEIIIQTELNNKISKGFHADLDIFNLNRLKNGEFKSLILKNKNIRYKAFGISDFYAETLCSYNKIVYDNKNLYYPTDLQFKYKGTITQEDINNVISSEEFQNELEKLNVIQGIKFLTPSVELKDTQIQFTIPVKTFLSSKPYNIKLNSEIEVKNDKIVLKNIILSAGSNIMDISMLSMLVNGINPISFEFESIKNKYFTINIKQAKITENGIETNGLFTINRNCGE